MSQASSTRTSELHIHVSTDETETEAPASLRRSYYAEAVDDQAVATIKTRFGFYTDSEAVRFALRLVAEGAAKITLATEPTRRVLARFR